MGTAKEMDLLEGENPHIDMHRRMLLRAPGLIALSSLMAVSLGQSMSAQTQAQSGSVKDDVSIPNVALGSEYQAIAAYQVGAESGLLQRPVLAATAKFQGHRKTHASVLAGTASKLSGTSVTKKKVAEYGFPVNQLKTQVDVLRFAAGLEKDAASAYLGVMPSFYTHDLAKAAVNTLGDETMHWAVLLSVLGEDPMPVAFVS